MTVLAFGEWDMKNGAMPDYSMDLSKIWEMHKKNKKELSRASLSGDDDLLAHHGLKVAVEQEAGGGLLLRPTGADHRPTPSPHRTSPPDARPLPLQVLPQIHCEHPPLSTPSLRFIDC
ncbi:hypothetical protein ZWY2020_025897 [Hordeum vulgare]|nr:hypothetical protein ZWY2020_025897 [Hordeum vulgare]